MKKLLLLGLLILFVGCPSTAINSANIYIQRGEYQRAKEQVLIGLKSDPNNYELYCLLAKTEIGLTHWTAASKAFHDAISVDSLSTLKWILKDKNNLSVYWQAFYNAAVALEIEQKYEAALKDLSFCELLNPNKVDIYILRGGIYAIEGKKNLAGQAYVKALALDPENPQAYFLIGKSFFDRKLYDSALVKFDDAIKHFDKKYKGIAKLVFKNLPEIDKLLAQKIMKLWINMTKMGPQSLKGRGKQVRSVSLKTGLATFHMSHEGSSNFAVELLDDKGELVELLVNEIGIFKGSKAMGIKNTETYVLDITADGNWQVSIEQGTRALESAGKSEEELDQLVKVKLGFDAGLTTQRKNIDRFYKLTQGLSRAYYLGGMSYYNLKNNKNALNYVLKSLDLLPEDLDALFYAGELFVRAEKYEDALGYFEKITELKADDLYAWFYIAVIHSQLKDYRKAIDLLEGKVLVFNPKFIDAMRNLAFCYRETGNTKKALEYLQKIEKLEKEQ